MSYIYDPLLGQQLVPVGAGSGAVIGPGSSVNGDIVIFNGTSGTMVSDSGYAFPIPPQAGGTGIANNAASTLTISGNFPATFTLTNTTGVTFPTSGTLATTAQLPTLPLGPSHGGTGIANNAASTLTISGNFGTTLTVTALTAVTLPTSGTLATTSQLPSLPLSPANGGTGVNNGTSTITLGGNLTTSGAFATIFTMTAGTTVTFPTSGTLATTSQLPSITATQYDVLVGGAANAIVSVGPGSSGQVLQSAGNATPPAYSTATYPLTVTSGDVLYASATNVINTLAISTYPGSQLIAKDTGVPIYGNPRNCLSMYDDFNTSANGSAYQWNNHASGGSAGINLFAASSSANPGVVKLYTASGTDYESYTLPVCFLGGGYTSMTFYAQLGALSNGTDRYTAYIGFASGQIFSTNNVLWFQYSDNVNSGKWQIVSNNGSSTTTNNTATAADTNFHRFRIDVNAAASSASFYIDDVQVSNSPISTNLPTGVSLYAWISIAKSAGASQVNLFLDYWTLFIDFTSSR